MLKLFRLALTAAVLTAIVVRLRRRAAAKAPELRPGPPPRRRMGSAGLLAAVLAAVMGGLAYLGAGLWPAPEGEGALGPSLPGGGWYVQERRPEAVIFLGNSAEGPAPAPVVSPGAVASPSPAADRAPHCAPEPRPVVARPLDPDVRRAVDRQWRRIERWLRANAPRTYAKLNGPGRPRVIAVAESRTGLDFPDDLRASLLRHDGGPGLGPSGGTDLSVRRIRDAWLHLCAYDDHGRWTGRMIPFHVRRGSAGMEYAAVDPATGAVTVDGVGAAPDHRSRLREIADALARGRELDGRVPEVRRGVLRWVPAR
ncbi:hypothetical protein [Nonomuraea sp. NPDC048826]|uniref:hypothetical protein n=1 Tax=Nonomuraea sp. NPDC048826 TaxID=3364347 RepID=UPI00371BD562